MQDSEEEKEEFEQFKQDEIIQQEQNKQKMDMTKKIIGPN
jgi:hypothetical protein